MKNNKKAQVTIFIIIAIVLIAVIALFFIIRAVLNSGGLPNSGSSEVFEHFDACVEQKTRSAISLAGSQGGYIDVPEFEPGSIHAPFSNQLDFLGVPVPYWYYVTSNGAIREQVPSKGNLEREISNFLNEELKTCDFSSLRSQGYSIESGEPITQVRILDNEVRVSVKMDLSASKNEESVRRSDHEVSVDSSFGEFYDLAREIYDKEKRDSFLEFYTQDTLFNYAPVTGSEISCSPLIWNAQKVSDDLKKGISANVQAIKVKNGNYNLVDKNNKYFVTDIDTSQDVRFLYDSSWPTRVEIWPADGNLLVAEPIGTEQGLGIIGFCYVPYHFVYDIYHPVLIQIYNENEIFQFPVAVVIDKSVPRDSLVTEEPVEFTELDNFCNNANTEVDVNTFDSLLNPVEADITFECFNELCSIGKTRLSGSEAILNGVFPQCFNGIVKAKAEGYVPGEQIISTNSETSANIVLDKLYDLPLSLTVGGRVINKDSVAIVDFVSDNYKTTVVYPNQENVKLAEGLYDVSVKVFSGQELRIPGSITRECVNVPKKGLLGFFGGTEEECFNIELPAQTLSNALSGGGKNVELILESDLRISREARIRAPSLPSPLTLDQLQQNYFLIDTQSIEVDLL